MVQRRNFFCQTARISNNRRTFTAVPSKSAMQGGRCSKKQLLQLESNTVKSISEKKSTFFFAIIRDFLPMAIAGSVQKSHWTQKGNVSSPRLMRTSAASLQELSARINITATRSTGIPTRYIQTCFLPASTSQDLCNVL